MPKKVYRSLFDSEDVYEVEELTDNPEVSTEGIAKVRAEDSGLEERLKKVEDAIGEIKDALTAKKDSQPENTGGSTSGNTPAGETKVGKVDPVIDEEKVEEEETSKEVKDAYSGFTKVGESNKEDTITATQVAFQNRYSKVANK